jgi:uncharacterized membrane protein SpoIIM required for sporulation
MSQKITPSPDRAVLGCALLLALAPLNYWLLALSVQLVWNVVLSHYVPVLPALSIWGAIAMRWSARVLMGSWVAPSRKDDRPILWFAPISQALYLALVYGFSLVVVHAWQAHR